MPGASGTMSAVIICAEVTDKNVGALASDENCVAVPVRRVCVVKVAERGDVPAHLIAHFHGHHGHVAVDVSVDGPLDVGGNKARVGGDGSEYPARGEES